MKISFRLLGRARVLLACSLVLGVSISVYLVVWWQGADDGESVRPLAHQVTPESATNHDDKVALQEAGTEVEEVLSDFALQSIQALKQRYDASPHKSVAQITLIDRIASLLQKEYGDDWYNHLDTALALLSPEEASALRDVFERMQALQREQKDILSEFSPYSGEEQENLLWDARLRLFGEDAKQIWQNSYRNRHLKQVMNQPGMETQSIASQQNQFIDAMAEVYADEIESFNAEQVYLLSEKFVEYPSVSQQLAQLSPEERWQALADMRKEFGMTDDAIGRLTALDKVRHQRQLTGEDYMRQRAALEKNGADEKEFITLRQSLFGDLAEKIASEEERGFFRYSQ